jgi:FkbM family methyltransferase
MRKRTKCLSIIWLVAFAFSCTLSSSFGVLKQNSSTEQLAQNKIGVNTYREGLREESNSKYIVDHVQILRPRFPDPCIGNLYPTPAEGKMVRAKVLDIEFDMYVYDHESVRDIVSDSIKASGAWEKRETQMLLNLVSCASSDDCQKRVFLDVGANIGWYSLTAAKLGYSVISFEPFRSNLGLICSSSRQLDESAVERMTVFNVGLDFKPRQCELFQQSSINIGDTHSVCDAASRPQFIKKGYNSLGWMNTTTLDITLEEGYFDHVGHVDIMKVDVEGFEYSVMEGGNRFFQSRFAPKYIFMELVSSMMGDAGGLSDRGESRLESVLMKLENYGCELEHFSNSAGAEKDHKLLLQTSPLREVRKFVDGKNILFMKIL